MAATMVNEQPAAYLKLLYLKLSVQQPHSPADSYCKASLTSERSECSTSADEGSCGHEENSELDDDVDNCLEYQHGDEPTFTEKRLAERSLTEDYEDEFDDNEEEVIDQQGVQSDDDTVESAEHLCTQVDGLFMREVCDDSTPVLVGEKNIGRQKVEDDSEQKEQEEAEDIQTRLRECFQRACENCSLDDGLETISVASEDLDDIYIESQEQIEQGVDNDLSAAIDRNSEAGEHMSVADTHLKVKEPVMRMCDEPPPEAPAEDGNDSDYAPLEAPAEDDNDSDYAPEELEEMLADDGVWAPPEVASEELHPRSVVPGKTYLFMNATGEYYPKKCVQNEVVTVVQASSCVPFVFVEWSDRLQHAVSCGDLFIQDAIASLARKLTNMASSGSQTNSQPTTPFHAARELRVSIHDYLNRLVRYFDCSEACLVLALVYLERLVEKNFLVCPRSVHRLLLTSLVVSAKFHDDDHLQMKWYAEVGAIQQNKLINLEATFLSLLEWQLFVPPREYDKCLESVKSDPTWLEGNESDCSSESTCCEEENSLAGCHQDSDPESASSDDGAEPFEEETRKQVWMTMSADGSSPFIKAVASFFETLASQGSNADQQVAMRFNAPEIPIISLEAYLVRITQGFYCSDACLVLAVIYADRLVKLHAETNGFQFCMKNVHRLLLTSMLVASKFAEDVFYPHYHYARVGGIKTKELRALEADLICLLEWRLYVPSLEFNTYFDRIGEIANSLV